MISDAYFETEHSALREVRRRRSDPALQDFATRMEESPYGGYRVRSMPADVEVEFMLDGTGVAPLRKAH